MEDGVENIEAIGLPWKLKLMTGSNGHSRKLRFLITGGCGYFGFKLAQALYDLGAHVRLLDLQLPSNIEKHLNERFTFTKGDVCEYSTMLTAFKDVDCVFHIASFGMSGSDQLCEDLTEKVNVNGTTNVILACQKMGVNRLLYTSTYNVVLGDDPIEWGDEDLPYADSNKLVDFYSKTKLKADKLVISANESNVDGGGLLRTCCLRPAGIYGPGERRHMKRIAGYITSRLIVVRIGDAMVDWVHVNNLIQAHLLAVHGLSLASNFVAAGKAYFVSDNKPLKLFDFLQPLFHGLGYEVPALKCPYILAYFFAFLTELLHNLLKPWYNFQPFLTRNEVMKMGIPHYHSMEKIMSELGYKPRNYEYADTVALYLKETDYDVAYPIEFNLFPLTRWPSNGIEQERF